MYLDVSVSIRGLRQKKMELILNVLKLKTKCFTNLKNMFNEMNNIINKIIIRISPLLLKRKSWIKLLGRWWRRRCSRSRLRRWFAVVLQLRSWNTLVCYICILLIHNQQHQTQFPLSCLQKKLQDFFRTFQDPQNVFRDSAIAQPC